MAGKAIAVESGDGFEGRVWEALKKLFGESEEFEFEEDSKPLAIGSGGRHSVGRRGILKQHGKPRGYICSKHDMYNFMAQSYVEEHPEEYDLIGQANKRNVAERKSELKTVLSKNFEPDLAFFDYERKAIVIVEMKTQTKEGSVDEKLETLDFKRRQYKRLAAYCSFPRVEFNWALDSKFLEPKYDNVKSYLYARDSYFEVGEVSLALLGLTARLPHYKDPRDTHHYL
jgi:hypothetical protein